MLTRLLTGLVLAPALVSLVLLGPTWAIAVVFSLAGLAAVDECARMTLPQSAYLRGDRWLVGVGAALVFASAIGLGARGYALGAAAGATIGLVGVMMRFADVAVAGRRAIGALAAHAYAACLFATVLLYLELPEPLGRHGLMLLFLTVFLGDTLAYFAGRAFGRHKLAPRVSPKKTIEGALGGLAGSVGGAFVGVALFNLPLSPLLATAVGLGAGMIEQVGDLAESLLKRAFDIKDSGNLLPGHGGMLDRLDGVLFASPWVYAALAFL